MTEKRFTYDKPLVAFSKGGINDSVTGETYEFTMDTVLDLLNEQHEENQQLREIISANRTITIPYTITDEKLVNELKEMFKEDLE